MIITLICIGLLIIGIVSGIITKRTDRWSWQETVSEISCCVGSVLGLIGCVICFMIIIINHAGVEQAIYKNQLTYESLVMQIESISSEYEDVSKTEVIQRVTEWNKDVYSNKYWAYNPWTNWFYSRELVDSLQYIDMEGLR